MSAAVALLNLPIHPPQPTLALTYADICGEIGRFLGYGYDSAGWGTDEVAEIRRIFRSGVRRFAYPVTGYAWSFLHPTTSLTTAASTATYDLPFDFGGIIGKMTFPPDTSYPPIEIVPEVEIRKRQQFASATGTPHLAAITPRAFTAGYGTRWQITFWPTPDRAIVLTYRYNALPDAVQDDEYPFGGLMHAETVLESCLAVAEERANDERGIHAAAFQERLAASMAQDMRTKPEKLGYNADNSDGVSVRWRDTEPGIYTNTETGVSYTLE